MKIIRSMYEAGKTIVIREQPKRKIEKRICYGLLTML